MNYSMKPLNLVGRKHPALHQQAAEIEFIEEEIIELASRMLGTVQVRRGLALAAPQVGVSIQLVVLHNGNALVNPTVEALTDEEFVGVEGCLSIPGRQFRVPRPKEVQVSGLTLEGQLTDVVVEGIDSRMWCHEADHLAGILISDHYKEVRR